MSVREWLYVYGTEEQINNAYERLKLSSYTEDDHFVANKSKVRFYMSIHDDIYISLLSFNYSVIPWELITVLLMPPVSFKEMSYGIEEICYFSGDVLTWRQRAKDAGVNYMRVRSAMAEATDSSPV